MTSGDAIGQFPGRMRYHGLYSFMGSILFHVLLLVVVLLLLRWTARAGVPWGERRTDSVGIVFSTPKGYENPAGTGGDAVHSPHAENALRQEAAEEENLNETVSESFLPAPERIGMSSGESTSSQTSNPGNRQGTSSSGKGGDGGDNGQSVGFSDVRGNGRRFVYVLDRSESMKWPNGRPMQYAIQEAQSSIMSLNPQKGAAKFQLVWFNHESHVFENAKLLEVTEPNKSRVCRFLASLVPDGATDPLNALETAIRLRPDVIFFLTDADEEIPPLTLERIHETRIRGGVRQIHVVEFGKKTAPVKTSFRQLADENQGQYIFKDINEL